MTSFAEMGHGFNIAALIHISVGYIFEMYAISKPHGHIVHFRCETGVAELQGT